MTARISTRAGAIPPFHVMDILARAREMEAAGSDIIHMEVGEPDFPTPQPIVEAGIAALRAGQTHYTPALGLPSLREAIASYYRECQGIDLKPSRVVVTPGASGALLLALGACLDAGNALLTADPGYPCNGNFSRFLNAEVVSVPVDADSGFQLTRDAVERHWTPVVRAILAASPSNPTGTLLPAGELLAIAEFCRAHDAQLLVDEIYHRLVYEKPAPTALALADDAWVINSFSKYFLMTGWRLGWLIAPEWAVPALDRLAQNLFLAAPTMAQHAALMAFAPETEQILEARKMELRERRDFLLQALRGLNFEIACEPQGAFYIYADVNRFTKDSFDWSRELLAREGVAVTPGIDFGTARAERFVRFAYTTPLARLELAVKRIGRFIKR
jgi:aspartate/methionine/tyrosine aminotransferase